MAERERFAGRNYGVFHVAFLGNPQAAGATDNAGPWPSRIATRPSRARLRVERVISICMVNTSCYPAAPLTRQAFREIIAYCIFRGAGLGTNDIPECFA